jgi:mono/diheme cytochrome c family protein
MFTNNPTLYLALLLSVPFAAADPVSYDRDVRPILSSACFQCHGPDAGTREAKLRLDTETMLGQGRWPVKPGRPGESEILKRMEHSDPDEIMPPPKSGKTVTAEQIAIIRAWISQGAQWEGHWAFRPLKRPAAPSWEDGWGRNAVDGFVRQRQRSVGLAPAPEADRFTLIRRLYYDLIGLPPTPEEIAAFENDSDPRAYEKLVKQLLASPHYGERWGRHWLDVVKYADTHGYDKDKLRRNAWPYRDYVIRSFNDDKPYGQFVREQVAGDVFAKGDPDGIIALGFIAAGPWDHIGHAEVPESKIDGKVARNLDRDDMVSNTLNSFNSLTIQCARCHDHKFDPVSMEHYYSLQAVFASIDKADREVAVSADVAAEKNRLTDEMAVIKKKQDALAAQIKKAGGPRLAELKTEVAIIRDSTRGLTKPPEHGWHSKMIKRPEESKWVQVDLGSSKAFDRVVLRACYDDFASIGAGFGFPVRFKVECSDDAQFKSGVTVLEDKTGADVANPRLTPYAIKTKAEARYIRFTATRLFHRVDSYMAALSELEVMSGGENLAAGQTVTSLDSIEAPTRWRRSNLVDGKYPRQAEPENPEYAKKVQAEHDAMVARIETEEIKVERRALAKQMRARQAELAKLPAGQKVYAGTVHKGKGSFVGRYGKGPREIRVLHRGEVTQPGKQVGPGTIPLFGDESWRFELPEDHEESARRAALAQWLTREDHPLTWRSIVNRVWQYHFGRGLVDSPNDFGLNGQPPSHPELLDWLAAEFRDGGQSFKKLHALIVTSATYRQATIHEEKYARIDGNNQFLWRQNRRRLDAESLRDSILEVSGKLDRKMYGPGFFLFALEKTAHSPHYEYHKHDPNDPTSHRRSVYRFIVRSQPDPFMTTLDCADSSQSTPKRSETITALQALSLLNNKFNLAMAQHFAARVEKEAEGLEAQTGQAYALATGKAPAEAVLMELVAYAETHGLVNVCRLMYNLSEFVYVD